MPIYGWALTSESKLMNSVFISSVKEIHMRRNHDLTVGCVEYYYNEGSNNYASTILDCECSTTTSIRIIPENEITLWLKGIDLNNPFFDSFTNQPWFKKLDRVLEKCRSKNHNNRLL